MHPLVPLLSPLFGLSLLFAPFAPAAAQTAVLLELVLAIDVSSSVNDEEFELQMKGLAQAFQSPDVLGALELAGDDGIAVSLLQWSGAESQYRALDWRHINDAASAKQFSADIDATPRFVSGGATAVGNAINESVRWIFENDFEGMRQVIDVSGDGRANQGESPAFSRGRAMAAGITVNGLAILNEEPNLARYYAAGVVGGTGSFLLTADDSEDFARAIAKKIYFEITGPPIVQRLSPGTNFAEGPRSR